MTHTIDGRTYLSIGDYGLHPVPPEPAKQFKGALFMYVDMAGETHLASEGINVNPKWRKLDGFLVSAVEGKGII